MALRLESPQLAAGKQTEEVVNYSSWIEIDLDALNHNLGEIKKHTKATVCPVLKGDAYGHGAVVLAAFFAGKGATLMGVGTIEEALAIREFCSADLLLLSPPLASQLPLVLQYRLIPTITSFPLLSQLAELAKKDEKRVELHLKVDTGLGRLGFQPREILSAALQIKKNPHLKLQGIYTHFAAAAGNAAHTKKQLSLLLKLKDKLSGPDAPTFWHAANSQALLVQPASHLDLVRIGTLLYGQAPLPLDSTWHLQKTWSFRTRLIQVKKLPKGHPVGYGYSFRTKKAATVGVIPVGYGHGLEVEPQTSPWRHIKQVVGNIWKHNPRVFSDNMSPIPILGRIGMGLTCLDLTNCPHLNVGDAVVVKMRRVTSATSVPRVYFQDGRVKCVYWQGKIYVNGRPVNHLIF